MCARRRSLARSHLLPRSDGRLAAENGGDKFRQKSSSSSFITLPGGGGQRRRREAERGEYKELSLPVSLYSISLPPVPVQTNLLLYARLPIYGGGRPRPPPTVNFKSAPIRSFFSSDFSDFLKSAPLSLLLQ